MAEEINMPSLGQTTEDIKILAWRKSEGDAVKQGDVLLEVETDKATLEVEAYTSGVLLKIMRAAGEVVEAGSPIAIIGQPGESAAAPSKAATVSAEAASLSIPGKAPAVTPPAAAPPGKVLASPVARKLAIDHSVDIAQVTGSGPGGRVEKEDVLAYVERQKTPVAPAAAPAAPQITEAPRHRRALAERLSRSFREIPHIYVTVRVDMTEARKFLAAWPQAGKPRLTYTHLLLQSAARALRAEPRANRVWLDDGRIKTFTQANVGLAVAGEDSLIVVTIPEPDRMTLDELASYAEAATGRARAGRLTGSDLAECALTISNLGMYRVDEFSAIIDPQQAAILAVGRVADEPVVLEGQVAIAIRPRMTVTLSADHRVIDGVAAAKFLDAFRADLEKGV
ncbi:MAG: 2-oxo acid dehydrogenase subunit E2 [Anaerolineae bacterium]|nr:2-oxo acid dehydrogenase subunit E2 [Anaerolineae bacterium]